MTTSPTTPAIDLPLDSIATFCERHHIRKMMLFGSVLREDFRPDSDVDVLVEFEPGAGITYFDLVEMQLELQDLLHRDVDLGTVNMLSIHIKDQVLASAQVVYERG
ncbi:MAG: nucleotidyltransferase family protein [Anaerolineae bacterium]|nr:nucleotidyltransferase family protein [Anaerolineae bacterium]